MNELVPSFGVYGPTDAPAMARSARVFRLPYPCADDLLGFLVHVRVIRILSPRPAVPVKLIPQQSSGGVHGAIGLGAVHGPEDTPRATL